MPINKITHVCLTHDKVRARNEKMLEDAKNGMSQEQLAEKYQICVSTVRYSLKDFYKEQARQRKAKKKAWQTQIVPCFGRLSLHGIRTRRTLPFAA